MAETTPVAATPTATPAAAAPEAAATEAAKTATSQPEPQKTTNPETIWQHFENLLHHIISTWGGRGRQDALKLWRGWHSELLAEIERIATKAAKDAVEAGLKEVQRL